MATKRKSTMVEMVDELEKLRPLFAEIGADSVGALDFLIFEAKAGEFHDFKNQKYVCGKHAICGMLDSMKAQTDILGKSELSAGLAKISADVKKGEYDEEPDAEDKKLLAADMDLLFGRK